jgi:GNAT superfamily N-acetyltransferase
MKVALEDLKSESVSIRLATPSDAPMLARMRFEFRAGLGTTREDEDEFVSRCDEWMQKRLQPEGTWICWIAESSRKLLGHLWLQVVEKIPNPVVEPENHAYITNFYVRDEARGKGLGSAMLATALAWCRNHDVDAVILWPTPRSRSLYLRHGFSVRGDLLELLVADIV